MLHHFIKISILVDAKTKRTQGIRHLCLLISSSFSEKEVTVGLFGNRYSLLVVEKIIHTIDITMLNILDDHTGVRSNSWPQISAFLSDRTGNSGTLHLTLWINNDTSVVFEVEEKTVLSSPWSSLTNDNGWHDLLTEFWLTLSNRGHNHVANTSSWQSVQSGTSTLDGDDVQASGARVIAAVDDGSDWETKLHISVSISSTFVQSDVPGRSYIVVYSFVSTSKHTDRFTESSSIVQTYSHLVFVTGSSSLLRHLLLLSFFDVW